MGYKYKIAYRQWKGQQGCKATLKQNASCESAKWIDAEKNIQTHNIKTHFRVTI